MVYHFVYKTINQINGKFYYGVHSTNDLNDGYLGSGKNLKKAIKKYGLENFSRIIICFFDSKEEALYVEKTIVTKELVQDNNCYNLIVGGGGSPDNPELLGRKQYCYISRELNKLKGDARTDKQKEGTKKGSLKLKGKPAWNRTEIELFGKKFKSANEAMQHYNLSTSHYYFMKNSDIKFQTAEELKEYTWKLRNDKISRTRIEKYGN